ncbi:MAG: hypothetical protein KAG66_18510, partial [Methylococcales bacterium]|nr:hypothetical protein [Methylococcales bacterium]
RLEVIIQPLVCSRSSTSGEPLKSQAFSIAGRVCKVRHRTEQIIGPQQGGIDRYACGQFAFSRIHDGAWSGADFLCNLLNGQVTAQTGCSQVLAHAFDRVFDRIGGDVVSRFFCGHIVLFSAYKIHINALESMSSDYINVPQAMADHEW